jgi:hypothetical protein
MTVDSGDNSPLSPALLKQYKHTMYLARRIKGTEIEEVEGRPKEALVSLVHSACNWPANMMAWGGAYIDALRNSIPLIEADPALVQTIGRTFTETQAALEGDTTTLTREQVTAAFAAYYHLIQPSTESARYVRTLIEEAFNVLELGRIPPAKYCTRVTNYELRDKLR